MNVLDNPINWSNHIKHVDTQIDNKLNLAKQTRQTSQKSQIQTLLSTKQEWHATSTDKIMHL